MSTGSSQHVHMRMSTNTCHDDNVQTLNWKLSTCRHSFISLCQHLKLSTFQFECELKDVSCQHDVSTN